MGRYSASSFRSASRPSRLGVSMIKRSGPVLDANHNDCVQLSSPHRPAEITQQVWCCSSRHIVSNVSEPWVNSCEVRDELESPLVVTPFLCTIEARRFSQVSRIQSHHGPVHIRVRIASHHHHLSRRGHRHHDHFVRLRNDFKKYHIPSEPSGATCRG